MPDTPAPQSVENRAVSGTESVEPPAGAHRAVGVLAVTLALVPVAGVPGEWVFQDTLKSAMLTVGVLCAAITLLLAQWRMADGPAPSWRWHGILLVPALLCAYSVGSMAWSHAYLAAVEACRWAVLGMLLWVLLQALHRETVPLLLRGVHVGAVGASAWVAAQFWADLQWFPQAAVPASTFVNRNFFAEYLVCTLPFSVYVLAQVRQARWRPVVALSVAFNIVALMMTGTRSALVAALAIAPVLAYVVWRYRQTWQASSWSAGSRYAVALLMVTGVLALGALPTGNATLRQDGLGATPLERSLVRAGSMARKTEYSIGSFSIRASMWRSTARMVMAHPLSGVGAGAWEVHIPRFQGWNNSIETDFYAHNEFLQLLGEYGLPVGGGALALLLAYLLWCTQRTWQMPTHGDGGRDAALHAAALCSLLALLIVSNAGFPWRLASSSAMMMVALSILAAGTCHTRRSTPRGVRAATAALVLGLALALGVSAQAMRAEGSIVRSIHTLNLLVLNPDMPAEEHRALQDRAFALLQEGVAIHPHYRKLTSLAADQFAATGNLEAALWAQDSVAASRPYIPDVHANRVLLHSRLHHPEAAQRALEALTALQPDAPRTRALGVLLLRRAGQDDKAAERLKTMFAEGYLEYDLVHFALAIGLEHNDEALAIQAYRLWAKTWPGEAQAQVAALERAPPMWRARMQAP